MGGKRILGNIVYNILPVFDSKSDNKMFFYLMSWGESESGKVIYYFSLDVRPNTNLKDIDILYPMLYIYIICYL
jgi:hypothetical protein